MGTSVWWFVGWCREKWMICTICSALEILHQTLVQNWQTWSPRIQVTSWRLGELVDRDDPVVYQGCKPLDQIPMVTLGICGKPSWIIFEENGTHTWQENTLRQYQTILDVLESPSCRWFIWKCWAWISTCSRISCVSLAYMSALKNQF